MVLNSDPRSRIGLSEQRGNWCQILEAGEKMSQSQGAEKGCSVVALTLLAGQQIR